MITFTDKLALATTLASYLDGTDFDLAAELQERNQTGLLNDPQFRHFIDERVSRCELCAAWVHVDTSCDCDEGEDWDYE